LELIIRKLLVATIPPHTELAVKDVILATSEKRLLKKLNTEDPITYE
jgi:hypothetical protein